MTKSRTTFRNGVYPFAGLFVIAVVGLAYLDMTAGARSGGDLTFYTLLCAGAVALASRSFIWTAVVADERGVQVRNPLRTQRFAWREIRGFRAEDRLVIELADSREVRCWAVQRANIARMLKRRSHADAVAEDLTNLRERYLA
ncbi:MULTISPECIES: PH domain-containing protein [Streptomyces]|uniref:PH domain-containing protein n=1 Tax=Streptomyces sudanensis TaxID=436397 RepID=A0ABY4TEC8_9ACTN|nr:MULTISPECIES: PH domain-containing protein [Streptomyces]MCP9946585.1 PH domain-containing protein [Streptomyces somaliensis]MCP9956876.1 PH domain-containing protein [Streptomyces sudanensis]MCP9960280.1 PH domain-containing protein [Streptomyces somaliensis]MCP9973047.1 PH domain-containing protein [Streptomyces somaliensis]MCQ0002543.1 PH domain-containing protein [Streptomyces sudanensis]